MPTHTHELVLTDSEVRKRFRSWDRGEPEREWACLEVLEQHAPGLSPRPLRRESEGGAPVVIMERLPGTPLGGAPLSPAQTDALGAALRKLYAVPLAAATSVGIGERTYGPSSLPETLKRWLDDDYDLSRCERPDLVAASVSTARGWLAGDHLPEADLSVLVIADLNPANVIWDGTRCRLIDFEDAGLSDPAYELADHVEHIASRLEGVYDAVALPAAVRLTVEQQRKLPTYRTLWATFWLAMLLPGSGGFHRNPRGTTERQASHLLRLVES